jgi:hypothetical protein
MKNSSDTIGSRSRDLPVCSAVPQPLSHRVPLRQRMFSPQCASPNFTPYTPYTTTGKISVEFVIFSLLFLDCRKKKKYCKIDGSDWSSTLIFYLLRLSCLAPSGILEATNIC